MRLPPGSRRPAATQVTFAVLKSMLKDMLGVATAYTSSYGIGPVSSVSNAPTT